MKNIANFDSRHFMCCRINAINEFEKCNRYNEDSKRIVALLFHYTTNCNECRRSACGETADCGS